MGSECLLCTLQIPDNDQSFGQFSEDTAKTCPEGLSAQRRKLTQYTKEGCVCRSGLLTVGMEKTSWMMESMKSSTTTTHLRRLRVAGDFNVDTLEGTAQGASSLAKSALPLSSTTQGASSPAERALHMPLWLSTTHLVTSSLAMFTRINGQKECGLFTLS